MSLHLSRRRLLACSLAGATVPLLGASEALATAVCVVPPEAGMWANMYPTEMETISRLRLRYECPRGLKGRGRWFVSAWFRRNRRTSTSDEVPWGEVEVRYESGIGSRLLEAEWPARGFVVPLRRLRVFVRMHHISGGGRVVGEVVGAWSFQKVPGAPFRSLPVTFYRPEVGL